MSSFNDHFETDNDPDRIIEYEAAPYSSAYNDTTTRNQQTLGDILGEAIAQADRAEAKIKQIKLSAYAKFSAKLYECVASHLENGDEDGANAILNAIGYAQQELK